MAKFITGKELEEAVYKIIWEADKDLIIVSPYIKLDNYFKNLFEKHHNNPKLRITLIFGKNEGNVDKSFNKTDLDFFLRFPNLSIVYVPNLHAKYYANDDMGVVTSINLYDYSFKHNLEFGVLYEPKGLGLLSKHADTEVWDTCMNIADNNELIYVKRPIFEKGFMGLTKTYLSSKILLDRTQELYSSKTLSHGIKKLKDFEEDLNSSTAHGEMPTRDQIEMQAEQSPIQPTRQEPGHRENYNSRERTTTFTESNEPSGFCIRTGVKIPFNPDYPLSQQAYQSWRKFSNEEYPEKYCHYSGEPSNGETCLKRPILYRNWKKAKQLVRAL